jgi:hypothetical protein
VEMRSWAVRYLVCSETERSLIAIGMIVTDFNHMKSNRDIVGESSEQKEQSSGPRIKELQHIKFG